MIEARQFDEKFYDSQVEGSYQSALVLLPLVNELLHPKSVLDVGCGVGTWLRVWKEKLGVEDFIGIDGDYVQKTHMQIPVEKFQGRDLKQSFDLGRKFDLVMSLEVGEHLPESAAATLVGNLVRHGKVILFSSANLGQHGTYHINEQPPEYWARLFAENEFVPVDIFRDQIWNDNRIEWWYRQNVILYLSKDQLAKYPKLEDRARYTNAESLFRIHPMLWKYRNDEVEERSGWFSFLRWKLSSIVKKK